MVESFDVTSRLFLFRGVLTGWWLRRLGSSEEYKDTHINLKKTNKGWR
jgi:hypothetical protein